MISAGPVVPGGAVFDASSGTASSSSTFIRFVDQQTGNVFSYDAATGGTNRIGDKTIPGIQSATWLPDASAAIVRYLSGSDFSTINTYLLTATSSDSGSFLPQDLAGVAVSSNGIFELSSASNGSSASVTHLDGTHPTTVFTTPLSQVPATFAGKHDLVFTKPSASLDGDPYLVNLSGQFSRIAGPLPGLCALPSPSVA